MSIVAEYRQLDTNGRLYLFFIGYFWLYGFVGSFWRRIGLDPNIANLILFFFLAVLCHGKWRHSIRLSDIVLYFFIVIFYFISATIYPISSNLVIHKAFEVLCVVVPFLFVGIIFKYDGYTYWLTLFSRLAVIINILFAFVKSSADVDLESMNRAYLLLPSVLYLLWQMLERFKLIDLFFFALGFFMLCSMGSRGPFVCILFFAFAYLFFFKEWKHRTIMRVFLVVGAMLLYLLSSYFAVFMMNLLSFFGLSTRIFDKMLNEALLNYEDSSGRNLIQEELLQHLRLDDRGIGYGLFSDRIFTDGFSSHNIFIEVWFSFGYYIGSVLLGIILLLYIRFFLKSKDNHTKVFGLIFLTASFVKLMFSGTFITDKYFFLLIGFCISGIRASRMGANHVALK